MNPGEHDLMHWKCCCVPMLGKGLWSVSFLALVGGFLAYWQGGEFLTVSVSAWYWNALVGGVLAIGAKAVGRRNCACQAQK